jgi:hypothetical protein
MIGHIYPQGDLDLTRPALVSGAEYACQKIRQLLLFFKGEWGWDETLGILYYQDILVKGPNLELIRGIYRREIMKVPGIVAVPLVTLEIDPVSRLLTVAFRATYQEPGTLPVEVSGSIP